MFNPKKEKKIHVSVPDDEHTITYSLLSLIDMFNSKKEKKNTCVSPRWWRTYYHIFLALVSFLLMWRHTQTRQKHCRGRVYLAYSSRLQLLLLGKSRQELKQLVISHPPSRAERNWNIHVACLLTGFLSFLLPSSRLNLQNSVSWSGLGLPTSPNNQDNSPHRSTRHPTWSRQFLMKIVLLGDSRTCPLDG